MAALSSPGSGPCLSQGVPEVYLLRCQVSSEEICGVFRKKWADDRPGKLRATTAADDLDYTQTHKNMRDFAGNVPKYQTSTHAKEQKSKTEKSVVLILQSLYACPLQRKPMYPPW